MHKRHQPLEHAFRYPHTFFAFDLSELEALAKTTRLFSYNGRGLFSLWDCDYLAGGESPIREQVEAYLPPAQDCERTLLVTSPRYCGYAFNPVNFYLRLRGDSLLSVIAEVNNTFKDRHLYVLEELEAGKNEGVYQATSNKAFHVSPFNSMQGEYRFTFKVKDNALHLGVDLYREDRCIMNTWIAGVGHSIERTSLLKQALLHPLDTTLSTMPRILWQAAVLHYRKKMDVFKRPVPTHPFTIKQREDLL